MTRRAPLLAAWLAGVAAGVAAGCAAPAARAPLPAPATSAGDFHRRVDGFEVLDAEGRPYDLPLLGGLNVPRPQLVDIDGDGRLDLFVQELTGEVMHFVREGDRFAWRSDRFRDLDVGEWFRFVDLDGDGDPDLLAETPFSYIRYYRNEGTPRAPRFALATDTLRDVEGVPIFSDRQNIPNVADVDCDGAPDLLIGRLTGTVTRYEQEGTDPGGVPRFRLVTDRFEDIEIVAQIGSLHGANSLELVDVDGDGDEDLFWGDFFEPGLLLLENTGSCARPNLRGAPVPFPPGDPLRTSGYNAPAFGDLDGDGDLDLTVGVLGGAYNPNRTSADNLYSLEQTEEGFILRTRRLLDGVDIGSESIPALADVDGDGDLDLLLANKIDPQELDTSRIYYFENVGAPQSPRLRERGPLEVRGLYHYAPALADLDGDGRLDMLLGSWGADVAWYRNEGTGSEPRFVLVDPALVTITRGSNTTPALADIDGDGDLDLFIGEASGTLNFYRNVGGPRSPRFELVSDEYLGVDVGRRSFPALADLDGDGDLDLALGSESRGLVVFRNDGTPRAPEFAPWPDFGPLVPPLAAPAFADLDGDGDLDLLSGGAGGGLSYFERAGR